MLNVSVGGSQPPRCLLVGSRLTPCGALFVRACSCSWDPELFFLLPMAHRLPRIPFGLLADAVWLDLGLQLPAHG